MLDLPLLSSMYNFIVIPTFELILNKKLQLQSWCRLEIYSQMQVVKHFTVL